MYEDRKKSFVERINAMIEYALSEENCRSRMLLRYFGEKNEHNCGQCDVCLQKHSTGLKLGDFQELKEWVLQTLKSNPCPIAELVSLKHEDKEKLQQVISFLLSEEIIQLKNGILTA